MQITVLCGVVDTASDLHPRVLGFESRGCILLCLFQIQHDMDMIYMVFLHRIRRSFFKYQKNYLSQNIVIGFILKTVHWTMFSLNAIGLEKKFLNEIVQSEKKNFHFNFLIFQFTRERIKLPKRFWHHSMCFQIMHIVSKFQFFIHISIVVKLKNKIQNVKRGGKKGEKERVFATFSMLHISMNWWDRSFIFKSKSC